MFETRWPEGRTYFWKDDEFHTYRWQDGPPPDWEDQHRRAEEATLR